MRQELVNACRAPISARCVTRTLALTTTDATVTLPEGGYEFVLRGSTDAAVIGHGVDTTGLPSSVATQGITLIPSGGAAEVIVEGSTVMHARVLAGTATLIVVKKADV